MIRAVQLSLIVLGVGSCNGQSIPPDIQKKLAEVQAAPRSEWLELSAKIIIPYIHELLWPEATKLDARLTSKPEVEIRMKVLEDAPYIEGSTIVYPALFLAGSQLSSFLVSHDLYVSQGGQFPVLDSVLQRPYANSMVIKWLRLGSLEIGDPVFVGLTNALACYSRDARCAASQNITWSSTLAFYLAHEYGHLAAGDAGAKEFSYSLDKEKAADNFAFRLLKVFGEGMLENENQRDYFALGPITLILVYSVTLPAGSPREDLNKRIDALLNLVPRESKSKYADLTNRPAESKGMSSLRIVWEGHPDWIAVDGVFYSPEELWGKVLRLTSDLHDIVAVGAAGIAWDETLVTGPNLQVHLTFQPAATGPANLSELAQLRRDQNWGEILRRTATPQLKPKTPDVALQFFEALQRVHLNALIDPSLVPTDWKDQQRRTVKRWIREGKPLSAWTPAVNSQ